MVAFQLGDTVTNKILNYESTINSVLADEGVQYSLNADICECKHSQYFDPH